MRENIFYLMFKLSIIYFYIRFIYVLYFSARKKMLGSIFINTLFKGDQ